MITTIYAEFFDCHDNDIITTKNNTIYAKAQLLEIGRRWLAGSKFYITLKDIKKAIADRFQTCINLTKSEDILLGLAKIANVFLAPVTIPKTVEPKLLLPFTWEETRHIKTLYSNTFDLCDWFALMPNEWAQTVYYDRLQPGMKKECLAFAKLRVIEEYHEYHGLPWDREAILKDWLVLHRSKTLAEITSAPEMPLMWRDDEEKAFYIAYEKDNKDPYLPQLVQMVRNRTVADFIFKESIAPMLNALGLYVRTTYYYQREDFTPYLKYIIHYKNRPDDSDEVGMISPQPMVHELGRVGWGYKFKTPYGKEWQTESVDIIREMFEYSFKMDEHVTPQDNRVFTQKTKEFHLKRGY